MCKTVEHQTTVTNNSSNFPQTDANTLSSTLSQTHKPAIDGTTLANSDLLSGITWIVMPMEKSQPAKSPPAAFCKILAMQLTLKSHSQKMAPHL